MQSVIRTNYVFSRIPEVRFGDGMLSQLPRLIGEKRRILLVTGSSSFTQSPRFGALTRALTGSGSEYVQMSVASEPSPQFVDQTVERLRGEKLHWVVAIGGGSVVDAGKAISAMLPQDDSVTAYLEGRATKTHDGRKIPFIAVPTSSGTGAEATKNAVLSEIGTGGYKSSLRHDNFVPDIALLDPELMLSCPPNITAACGLDALTQLIESYVSSTASPMTDALAVSGLQHVQAGFIAAYERGDTDLLARGQMAYAALISGITLANAGLGLVHGFAGPIGGFFPIPHGVVCGTLLGEATRWNIKLLFDNPQKSQRAIEKYANAGALLSGKTPANPREDCDALVQILDEWISRTALPRLGDYGITEADLPRILDKSNNKNSPIQLDQEQMAAILKARL